MKFSGKDLAPWADFRRRMDQARSLRVTVGGKALAGDFDLDVDDDGVVTMAFPDQPKPKAKKK